MADRQAARSARVVPWELRVAALMPVPAFVAGVVIAVLLTLMVSLLNGALSVPLVTHDSSGDVGLTRDFRNAIITCMLIGYTMAAGRYLTTSIMTDLREVGRRDPSAETGRLANLFFDRSDVTRGRLAGLAGIAFSVLLIEVVSPGLRGAQAGWLRPEQAWSYGLTPLLGFLLARAAYNSASGIRNTNEEYTSKSAAREIDLLNLDKYYVDGRIGLRLALVWIVGSSIASLFFFDPDLIVTVSPVIAIGFCLAVAALTLPVRRLHRRIREAKRSELAAVRTRIRASRDAVMAGSESESGRLADLLGYRSYLDGLREWPFDNTTVARFILYLLIPLGSWLGGAMVERLLANWLD
jgi:hypothetical protein